jgi:anthranilate synthase component II
LKVLIIDNYDSFVYNLVQYVGEQGTKVTVYRNDKITLSQVQKLDPDRIVLSPGPGNPTDEKYFGVCKGILQQVSPDVPTLGVCLGHQGIIATFGGKVGFAKRLMHGKTSKIKHNCEGIFRGVENPFVATRYHSLAASRNAYLNALKLRRLLLTMEK